MRKKGEENTNFTESKRKFIYDIKNVSQCIWLTLNVINGRRNFEECVFYLSNW